MREIGIVNFNIELQEKCVFNTKQGLSKNEGKIIKQIGTLKKWGWSRKEEYYLNYKEEVKQKQKEYYLNNIEKVKIKKKEYFLKIMKK